MATTYAEPSATPDRPTRGTAPSHHPGATIVQVVQSLGNGGLETLSVNLAVGLRDRGLVPAIVALDAGGTLEERLRDEGIAYHVLGGAHYASPRTHARMARLLSRLRPTAVHTHHLPALLNAAPAARLAGARAIVHTEHAYQYLVDAPRLRTTIRWFSRATRAFAVVGDEMAPFYRDAVGVDAARLRVIRNGIDVARYQPPRDRAARRAALGLPDGFLVGTVGRFAPEKNLPMLLRAAAAARAAHPELRVVMVGDGGERAALERLATDLGIHDAVHFLGWRTDVPDVLGCLDVFALTSWTEGLPLAVLEAMACGVVVAATAVGDLPNVLVDGTSGFLLAPDDAPALARVFTRLADAPADREAVAAAGRGISRSRYGLDAMVDAYVDAYGLGSSVRVRS